MSAIGRILVTFPDKVVLESKDMQELQVIVNRICERWEESNPGYLMWPAGTGQMPIWEQGDVTGWDASVYNIECSARPAYHESERIMCSTCGKRADDAYREAPKLPWKFCCKTCERKMLDRPPERTPLYQWCREHPEESGAVEITAKEMRRKTRGLE